MKTVATYTLSVLCPEEAPAEEGSAYNLELLEQRVLADLPARLEAVEEDLGDLLPEGWQVTLQPQE